MSNFNNFSNQPHRYSLEKGSKKHHCPECGKKLCEVDVLDVLDVLDFGLDVLDFGLDGDEINAWMDEKRVVLA